MVAMLIVLLGFARGLRQSSRDPEFRAIGLMLAALLAAGTVFYSSVEGWSVVDAMYFSMITLTTVGYGDLAPRTVAGKLFTMVYLVLGIGVIVSFANRIARGVREQGHPRHDRERRDPADHPSDCDHET
jgi:voltage-gated potassium channel